MSGDVAQTTFANPLTANITFAEEDNSVEKSVQVTVEGDTQPALSSQELKLLLKNSVETLPKSPFSIKKMQIATTTAGVPTNFTIDNGVFFSDLNRASQQPLFAIWHIDHAVRVFEKGNTTITATLKFKDGTTKKISWDDPWEGLYATPGERTISADQYRGVLQEIRKSYPNGLGDVPSIEFTKSDVPGVPGETKVAVNDPALLKSIQTAVTAKEGTWGRELAVLWLVNKSTETPAEQKNFVSNNPEVLKETAPLTKEVLEKISTETAAGKFLHTIGDSKSIGDFLGKDANDPDSFCKKVRTSLKELGLNPIAGTEVTNWLDTSKKILVSVDDVKISTQEKEDIIRLLKRHPNKEMADNLVFFFEIGHTMITNGADPQKNGPKMIGKNQYSGADQDLTTISSGDMIGVVDDMKKNARLKKYADAKTAYEFLAFYRNLVALYKEAK